MVILTAVTRADGDVWLGGVLLRFESMGLLPVSDPATRGYGVRRAAILRRRSGALPPRGTLCRTLVGPSIVERRMTRE
jgi:hypothetical protein